MKAVWIAVLCLLYCICADAQIVNLQGKITDQRGSPIPFVSVWIGQIHRGATTNRLGLYQFNLDSGTYRFDFRIPGYEPLHQTVSVTNNSKNHDVQLNSIAATINKTDPVDSIIRQVIIKRSDYNNHLPALTGNLYSKAYQQLDDAPKMFLKKDVATQLNLTEDRKGIFSLSESIAEFHSTSTTYIKEQVSAAKMTNDSIPFSFNSAAELHVSFYQNTLLLKGLSEHEFLSPIALRARRFYSYRLVGRFYDNDKLIDVISVKPRHRNEHLFTGTIGIVDKDWLLYNADLGLARDAHIDFLDSVRIRQQFVPINGVWINQSMKFNFYGKLFGFKYSGYMLQIYQDIHHDTTTDKGPHWEVYHSSRQDYKEDENFWQQHRPAPLLDDEDKFYQFAILQQRHKKDKTLTDSLQNSNNRFALIPYLFNGYTLHDYRHNSLITIPSPYNMVFYNTVEGWGIDLKVRYKKIYKNQHSLVIIPEARYGFSDHVVNANVFADYVYNPFSQGSVYGRVGSDFLDLNDKGTINPFLNSLSTLLLGNNYIKLYQSKFILAGTTREVTNGILLNGAVEYAYRLPLFNTTLHTFNKDSALLTSNNPLDPNADTPLFPPYHALIIRGSATFTFDQEYKITPAGKFILPNPYPRVRINFREGIPYLGSNVNYSFVSLDVFQDRLEMGLYGYTSYYLSTGRFLNTRSLYYPDYNQFSGGQSFFFDATLGSFHFLNYYTYSTDRPYFEAHAEHNFTGMFLSHVPLLNRLNLQEIIGGSFLTQGTLPDYKEVYIGLKRTVIRLDYGLAYGRYTNSMQGFRLTYNL